MSSSLAYADLVLLLTGGANGGSRRTAICSPGWIRPSATATTALPSSGSPTPCWGRSMAARSQGRRAAAGGRRLERALGGRRLGRSAVGFVVPGHGGGRRRQCGSWTPPALAAAFAAGLARLRAQTPAGPGDKTMLDALLPAVDGLRQGSGEGLGLPQDLRPGRRCRRPRRRSTKQFAARYGRARNLGPAAWGTRSRRHSHLAALRRLPRRPARTVGSSR